jgi:UTP--glucose-1-phosphate uridylyltransferase
MDVFDKYGDIVLSGMEVTKNQVSRFGIVKLEADLGKGVFEVSKIIEKPTIKQAPSNIAAMGGYILPPEIFDAFRETKVGKGGELWLVDAISKLAKNRAMYIKIIDGIYRDTGTKEAWLKTNIALALEDKDLKKELKKYIKTLL